METISIALICSLIGCVGTLLTISRNKSKDTKEETEGITKITQEIKYVSKGVDDIKYDMRDINRNISEVNEKVIRLEESCKSAHKRLDNLEG
jgi:peptidoglycan hydrolase CwlO-like protein